MVTFGLTFGNQENPYEDAKISSSHVPSTCLLYQLVDEWMSHYNRVAFQFPCEAIEIQVFSWTLMKILSTYIEGNSKFINFTSLLNKDEWSNKSCVWSHSTWKNEVVTKYPYLWKDEVTYSPRLTQPRLEPRFEETGRWSLITILASIPYGWQRALWEFTVLFPIVSTMQFWAQASHPRDYLPLQFENSTAEEMRQSHLSLKHDHLRFLIQTVACPLPLENRFCFCFCIKSRFTSCLLKKKLMTVPNRSSD